MVGRTIPAEEVLAGMKCAVMTVLYITSCALITVCFLLIRATITNFIDGHVSYARLWAPIVDGLQHYPVLRVRTFCYDKRSLQDGGVVPSEASCKP